MSRSAHTSPYAADRWIRLIGIPLIAFTGVHLGNDNTISSLLRNPSYYTDLLFALLLTAGVWSLIRRTVLVLDQRFTWEAQPLLRALLQLGITLVAVGSLTVITETLYLEFILDIRLGNSSMFTLELPLALLFTLIVNLLYAFLYLLHQVQVQPVAPRSEEEPESVGTEPTTRLLVRSGQGVVPVPVEQVAFFQSADDYVLIKTFTQEEFLYESSLDKLQRTLPSDLFFRANRQYILHLKAVRRFAIDEQRRLLIDTVPSAKEPVLVSKNRAAKFKSWMQRTAGTV